MGMRREIQRKLGRVEKKGQKPKKTHVTQIHTTFNRINFYDKKEA